MDTNHFGTDDCILSKFFNITGFEKVHFHSEFDEYNLPSVLSNAFSLS